MAGRALNPVELDAYDLIPRHLAERVRIHRVPRLAGGYVGMTLGFRILLARDEPTDGTSSLLAHELVHVRQWAELGPVGFSTRYLRSFGRGLRHHGRWQAAYRGIDAEAEARVETAAWVRRRLAREAKRNPSAAPADERSDHQG